MTEVEAKEIVERYEALVAVAARAPEDALWSDADLLRSHRLTLRNGRLELQALEKWLDYDVICHDFEPAVMQVAFA